MLLKCKSIIFLAFALFIFTTAPAGFAAEIPAIPANPVVDLAGIIDDTVETKINRYSRELERKTTAQMAILTVKNLEGQTIEEFSLAIAHDQWKLGQKGKDNGVLLVTVLKARKYRIEVGYGLEGVLPDSLEGTENRIAVERKRYNDSVQILNTYIRTIFGRLYAMPAGVSAAEYYEIPEAEKAAPKVKF
jgi:uncharacterized protein